jgi:hypothetical protein
MLACGNEKQLIGKVKKLESRVVANERISGLKLPDLIIFELDDLVTNRLSSLLYL